MENSKRLMVGIVIGGAVALVLGVAGAWYTKSWLGISVGNYVITQEDIALIPLLNPQAAIPPFSSKPEWGFAYSGIIEAVDVKNKFLDLRIPPLFPASLAAFGYADVHRFYFDDELKVRLTSVKTENGVATNVMFGKFLNVSALKPGWPARVFGRYNYENGFYSVKQVSVWEFLPGLPLQLQTP